MSTTRSSALFKINPDQALWPAGTVFSGRTTSSLPAPIWQVAGDGSVPHDCIGGARRMMVPNRQQQHTTMIEAVQVGRALSAATPPMPSSTLCTALLQWQCPGVPGSAPSALSQYARRESLKQPCSRASSRTAQSLPAEPQPRCGHHRRDWVQQGGDGCQEHRPPWRGAGKSKGGKERVLGRSPTPQFWAVWLASVSRPWATLGSSPL